MVDIGTDPLPRQRYLVLGLLLVVAALAWLWLLWLAATMNIAAMGPTMGMGAALFLAMWVIMMVAMMFPAAAPMILTFHRIQAGRRQQSGSFVATWIFVAGYLAVWTLSGVPAYAGAVAAEATAQWAGIAPATAARIGGALLLVAGLYQFTPWKNVCLAHCRSPTMFIVTSWRDGPLGAFRMGVLHGAYCLGCCWLLFLILFPLGIMNIAAMALVTVLVLAEKSLPGGNRIAQIAATLLVIYGVAVLIRPAYLPTFMGGGAMSMPSGGMPMPAEPAAKMPKM